MAPIRWTGNTGTSGTTFSGGDGVTSMGLTNSLSVAANSFIVAPWLGQWSAGFGRNTGTGITTGVGSKVKNESSSNVITGGVNLVPTSDFPFSAQFTHNTSEARGGQSTATGSATGIGLTQKYRTNNGRDNYSARYNRSIMRSGQDRNVSSSMGGDFTTRREFDYDHFLEGSHLLSASVNFVPQTATTSGGGERQLGGDVTHDWKVHEDLSINTRLSMRNSQLELLQGNALLRNDSTFLLGTSSFAWRPFEEEPLSLTGGASVSNIQTETGVGTPLTQQAMSANVAGTYTFNKNLTAGAGLSGSTSSSGTARFNNLNASANVGYTGDTQQLGSFSYGWTLGGGLNGSVANPGTTALGASANGSHTLYRTIVIDPQQSVGLNASQGLSVTTTQNLGTATSLSNSAGANWNASHGEAFTTGVAANVSHTATSGTSSSQALATSLAGSTSYRHQFSARATATLTGTINWTRSAFDSVQSQTLNQIVIDGRQTQLNGNVIAAYNHIAPFSVPNMFYNATLFWNFNQSGAGIAGASPQAGKLNTSTTLQQSLRYRVGRLSFSANGAVISSGGSTSYSLFGSVSREFDGFFDGRW